MKNKIINPNMNTNNIITCDNVKVCVGPKKHKEILIDNFSYTFEKSKVYAIVGNSGVGKTTLVNHLSGIVKTKSGNIFIKDKVILASQRKIRNYKDIRKVVSIVFQFPEYQIFKDTVEKDIAFGPINYHVNKKELPNLVSKYMYLVGLDKSFLKANPFDLSNGQKRLVALAGVLAIDSDVVILDEPTAGLDPFYQNKVIDIINKLKRQNKTIIVITHNMDNVLELADEVLVLHNNSLIKSGTPYSIYTDTGLISQTQLSVPHIIQTIISLKNQELKQKLLAYQPKNINDLAFFLKKGGTL